VQRRPSRHSMHPGRDSQGAERVGMRACGQAVGRRWAGDRHVGRRQACGQAMSRRWAGDEQAMGRRCIHTRQRCSSHPPHTPYPPVSSMQRAVGKQRRVQPKAAEAAEAAEEGLSEWASAHTGHAGAAQGLRGMRVHAPPYVHPIHHAWHLSTLLEQSLRGRVRGGCAGPASGFRNTMRGKTPRPRR